MAVGNMEEGSYTRITFPWKPTNRFFPVRMKEAVLYLTPAQMDHLLDGLHAFHEGYGALDTLLDSEREALLLEGFRELLGRFFAEGEASAKPVRSLAETYHAQHVPFALLMGSFNHMKAELVEAVAGNTDDPFQYYREIDETFERIKRETARGYLLCEVRSPDHLPTRIMREKMLIRIYLDWLEAINHAIGQDDLSGFPLEAADQSLFTRALRYPESMLICLDLKLCDQILDQHRLIHQQASILYAMLSARRFEQAYIAYQDMIRKVAELLNLLSVLYFESQTNRIGRFFSFLQAALYLPGRKFLSVINLRDLQRINKLHGTDVGDRALDCVEKILRKSAETHREWLVFTRGITGDFYLIGFDSEPETVRMLLQQVHREVVAECGKVLPVGIDLLYRGIELTDLHDLTTENMHLLVQYLTEQAREADEHLLTGEEPTREMLEWIKHQYHKSLNLQAKLTEEQTDIFIQPLVTLDSRREIHAFEVLGRFRDGEGYISAGLFIDDIIAMGLATEFDRLVLKAVGRQAAALGRITSRLFINVSAASLEDPGYLEVLHAALAGPLQHFEVVLELTEQVLLARRARVTELHAEHGLVFAIDDFGTGYSTLQTVIELALEGSVRYLKLDGSLTRDITTSVASQRIMQITLQMARALDLETVVEYVETVEQADRLEGMRMDFGQGYLLGVPDPVPIWLGKLKYLESKHSTRPSDHFTL